MWLAGMIVATALVYASLLPVLAQPANPPDGFRSFRWGTSPGPGLRKMAGPTDGVVLYVPAGGKTPPPLFELPVAEEAYSFSNGRFYSGSAWLDGENNFKKMKVALTRKFDQPSFSNERLNLWKWRWPRSGVEVHPFLSVEVFPHHRHLR
ncbi:MAG: hypothetical protein L0387_33420 [Acidobacteria bacterium]|nr:hypothetical protein [Acidobacteriota bacterium]